MRIGANCGLYSDDPASWLEWVKKSKISFVHVMGLIRGLDEDMPVLAEHLETEEEYLEALKVLREAAGQDDSGQDKS